VSRLQEGWINIKLPEASASEQRSAGPALALTVSIDAENRIMADRRQVAGETELAAVAKKFAGDAGPEAPVVMIADRSSKSGTLVGALKAVRDAGLTNISFSYEPRKERR
jgi:biopolymer transport protein ExbD